MHSQPMPEHEGTFADPALSDRRCPLCGSLMLCRVWSSNCGGYEDEKFTCTENRCGHSFWVDGIDS
jgi:ssDNA-binding Zn-finger/Zn-ribbon topoisomerase 1